MEGLYIWIDKTKITYTITLQQEIVILKLDEWNSSYIDIADLPNYVKSDDTPLYQNMSKSVDAVKYPFPKYAQSYWRCE